jgi:hypothetical protein
MRILLTALFLALTGVSASAQTSTPAPISAATAAAADSKSDWARAEALKKGTTIRIKTQDRHKVRCVVGAVDAATVTCSGGTFKADQIEWIKTSHRLRSTMVGFAVATGITVISVAIADSCHSNAFLGCLGAAAVAALVDVGAFIAAPLVFGLNDLTAGTVYRKPEPVH